MEPEVEQGIATTETDGKQTASASTSAKFSLGTALKIQVAVHAVDQCVLAFNTASIRWLVVSTPTPRTCCTYTIHSIHTTHLANTITDMGRWGVSHMHRSRISHPLLEGNPLPASDHHL